MLELLMLINAARIQPLTYDAVLTAKAEERADFLCASSQWSHDGWVQQFTGLPYVYVGENLAKGFKNDKSAHLGLMGSPGHRANIVNPKYKKVGIGKEKCGKEVIVVELFGG